MIYSVPIRDEHPIKFLISNFAGMHPGCGMATRVRDGFIRTGPNLGPETAVFLWPAILPSSPRIIIADAPVATYVSSGESAVVQSIIESMHGTSTHVMHGTHDRVTDAHATQEGRRPKP